nr:MULTISPECIES: DUF3040 domain-containing protein [unclassified Corynebacterium]
MGGKVALSEQEQKLLREIEESLLADDPKFGSTVASSAGYGAEQPAGKLTIRSFAIIVLGLLLLIGGVALATQSIWFVIISIVGFVVMFAGGMWALQTPNGSASPAQETRQGSQAQRNGMSSRMEENFRRRFEDR